MKHVLSTFAHVRPSLSHLVVSVHAMLVCIQAPRAWVAGVVHKHPVHTLVNVVEVANLSAHDVDAHLWKRQQQHSIA